MTQVVGGSRRWVAVVDSERHKAVKGRKLVRRIAPNSAFVEVSGKCGKKAEAVPQVFLGECGVLRGCGVRAQLTTLHEKCTVYIQ